MKRLIALLIIAVLLLTALAAQAATTPIDFTGFTGAGFAPEPTAGQLDSDIWRVTGLSDGAGAFGGTHTSGDFARGSSAGGVTTGGIYAFDVGGGDIILGVQPTGDDFSPGVFTLRVQNTTGALVTDVYMAYDIWTRNDQGRANSLNFAYSTDDSTYTGVPALDYTTPEAADTAPAWVLTPRSTTIAGLNLADGQYVYLSWTGDDVSGSGSRDEYGIDNIEVRIGAPNAIALRTLTGSSGLGALPVAGVIALGAAGAAIALRRRRYQSPAIVHDATLEAQAGSPLGDQLLDPLNDTLK